MPALPQDCRLALLSCTNLCMVMLDRAAVVRVPARAVRTSHESSASRLELADCATTVDCMSTILRSDTRDPTYGKTSAEPSDEVASPSGHVLFVLDHFYPHVGGGETLFFELTRALAARGWQVTVVTLRSPGMPREERLDGVRVVRVSTPPFARRYWFIVAAILPALRLSIGANLVHAGGYAAAWAAWFAGWWGRLPKVLTVYEVFADQWLTLGDVPWLLGWSFQIGRASCRERV